MINYPFLGVQISHQLDYKQQTDEWHIFGDGNARQLVDINIYHLTLRKSKINRRQKGNRNVKRRFAIHSFQSLFRTAAFPLTSYVFYTIFQNLAPPKANGGGLDQSRERHRQSLCCDFFWPFFNLMPQQTKKCDIFYFPDFSKRKMEKLGKIFYPCFCQNICYICYPVFIYFLQIAAHAFFFDQTFLSTLYSIVYGFFNSIQRSRTGYSLKFLIPWPNCLERYIIQIGPISYQENILPFC